VADSVDTLQTRDGLSVWAGHVSAASCCRRRSNTVRRTSRELYSRSIIP